MSERHLSFIIDGVPQQKRSPKLTTMKTATGKHRAAAFPEKKNTVNIQSIRWLIRQAGWSAAEPIHRGPVTLNVTSWFPIPQSWSKKRVAEMELTGAHINMPDADRLANMVMDAMKGIVIKDDSQVSDLHSVKLHTDGQPRVDVNVTLHACEHHVLKGK